MIYHHFKTTLLLHLKRTDALHICERIGERGQEICPKNTINLNHLFINRYLGNGYKRQSRFNFLYTSQPKTYSNSLNFFEDFSRYGALKGTFKLFNYYSESDLSCTRVETSSAALHSTAF